MGRVRMELWGVVAGAAVAAAVCLAGLAGTASGAFPGSNGRIYFNKGTTKVFSIRPDGTRPRFEARGYGSSVSPGGDRVAVTRPRGLYTVDLRSGAEVRVTSHIGTSWNIRLPSFLGPDGSRLIFSSDLEGSDDDPDRDASIWSIRTDGSGLTQLTSRDGGHIYDGSPQSSPDGSTIAFTRSVTPRSGDSIGFTGPEVFVMASDGSGLRRLTFSGRGAAYNPSFSPDGERILYERSGEKGGSLRTVTLSGRRERRITRMGDNLGGASFSPNGKQIIATGGNSGALVRMSRRGKGRTRVTPRRFNRIYQAEWAVKP